MNDLLNMIAAFKSPNVFNPWMNLACLMRLQEHFDCNAEFLLIGEAPGYQGCRWTGVPFTSERLVLDGGIPRVTCGDRTISGRDRPYSEPSATVVWGCLHKLGIADRTVMWNAFAWHPHKPGNPESNRAPTRSELQAGADVLHSVLQHFNYARYVAVGQVAKKALETAGVSVFATVRHPSMGGATLFREQMRALVAQSHTDGGEQS